MPLVYAGAEVAPPAGEARQRARKIDPAYTRGELVRVAGSRNLAEAELIQGLLIEEGVPSLLRRTRGFDVPDFLAAGPRDVLVPESGADAARQVLQEAAPAPDTGARPGGAPHPAKVLAAVLGGGIVAALIAWALLQLAA